ncbi:MAG: type II toxin-antitoxin system Phd/YefM family antitoxin [Candidatus Latescibacteria bacterium]|nr:type II toxin-antitoxin system Phd/YefM family antitoxin [Candidatus Latescibacterota bacterium]
MNATVVDLRYRMRDVLKAIDRNEEVKILYHGKLRGIIVPKPGAVCRQVTEHPFFNMSSDEISVEEHMDRLREERYGDL